MREWICNSATAMAAAIRKREISAYELVRACLRRIEEVNPGLNAVAANITLVINTDFPDIILILDWLLGESAGSVKNRRRIGAEGMAGETALKSAGTR